MLFAFVSFSIYLAAHGYSSHSSLSHSFKRRLKYSSLTPSVLSSLRLSLSEDASADESNESNDSSSSIFYNDFEQDIESSTANDLIAQSSSSSPSNVTEITDKNLSQLLQKRTLELLQSSRHLLKNWKSGKATSFGAFTINEEYFLQQNNLAGENNDLPFDWVRRVDIGQYPRVTCGSAHGSIFVADVKLKRILGVARGVHYSHHSSDYVNALDEQLRQYIYGEYDGGGVLAVAMFGKSIVASAGREGGVKLFKMFENNAAAPELMHQGDIQSLIRPMPGALPIIVTCMKFDSIGRLYLGGSDGFLRIVTFPDDFILSYDTLDSKEIDVTIIPPSAKQEQPPSPILSLDVSEELDMVVTACVNGNVCVYSIKEQGHGASFLGVWNPFIASGKNHARSWNPFIASGKNHARSVTFASSNRRGIRRYAVVVGGGNGEMWISDIHPSFMPMSSGDDVDKATEENKGKLFVDNSAQKFQPNHVGSVISLASRGDIVVSVGHDGMLRMTQAWIGRQSTLRKEPTALYGLGGYKVWVGSICIDEEGKRLVSDGMDDAVIVHDFSKDIDNDMSCFI